MSKNNDFSKVLSRADVIVLAFGAMIGWGWVVLSGDWISKAGSLGAMIAFLIGGIMVTFVGLVYSELTTALPKTGGAHHFAQEAFGPRAAFAVSWSILLGYVSVVAFEAVALPTVIEYIFPNYQVGYMWTIAGWDVYFSWVGKLRIWYPNTAWSCLRHDAPNPLKGAFQRPKKLGKKQGAGRIFCPSERFRSKKSPPFSLCFLPFGGG